MQYLAHNIHTHTHTTAHDPVSQPMHKFYNMHSIFLTFLSQLQIWVTIIPNKIIKVHPNPNPNPKPKSWP